MSNYLNINKFDVANGPGIRVSIFLAGCSNNCPGCFNPESHDFNAGKPYDSQAEAELMTALSIPHIDGISILGGEPLHIENFYTTKSIAENAHRIGKTVWIYTGYTFEWLKKNLPEFDELLKFVDVIIDGSFDESKKNLSIAFRGSSNQRIIDVQETIKNGKIALWKDGNY